MADLLDVEIIGCIQGGSRGALRYVGNIHLNWRTFLKSVCNNSQIHI